jgi:hypothetical protein
MYEHPHVTPITHDELERRRRNAQTRARVLESVRTMPERPTPRPPVVGTRWSPAPSRQPT